MAIDTAEKRRSVSALGQTFMVPGVTPFALQDQEWRQEAGWNYSGILVNQPIEDEIEEDDMSQGKKFHRNIYQVKPLESYLAEIAAGRITNAKMRTVDGFNAAIVDTLTDLTELGVAVVPLPASAITMEVVSNSVNDAAAGTGAQTVEVHGLDTDWVEIDEIITLNGTTPVALVNSYRRINDMHVMSAGSGGVAAGTISLQATGAGTEYDRITVGGNENLQAHFTVPDTYSAFIHVANTGIITDNVNTAGRVTLRATVDRYDRSLIPVYHFERTSVYKDGSGPVDIGMWYPSKCDIKLSAKRVVGAQGVIASGGFNIYLFRNDANSESGTG